MKLQIQLNRIQRAKAKAARGQLLIYGDIGDFGFEGCVSAKAVTEQLNALDAPELVVHINSYGGRIDEGLAIYQALRAYRGTVVTRVEGVAASIASIIMMGGSRVEIARGAMVMIHGAWQQAEGNAADLKSAAAGLDKADQSLAEIYARKTGRTAEEELARIKAGGDRWYTAEEAVAERYADAVYDPEDQQAALAEPLVCAALERYVPIAGAYASALRKRLHRSAVPIAAAAAQPPPEAFMDLKKLAQTLGINVAADADDAAVRAAICEHLALDAKADDAAIALALATRVAEMDPPAADDDDDAKAKGKNKPSARAAQPMLGRSKQVEQLFAIAASATSDAASKAQLNTMKAQALISEEPMDEVRKKLMAHLAVPAKSIAGSSATSITGGEDQRDKRRAAGAAWLMARSGQAKPGSEDAKLLNGNPFRGMSFHDMARDCLEEAGAYKRGMNRHDVIMNAITHSTSDFPNIFENALHKTMLRGFELQKPTWNRFCKTGSLTDFRPHIRYRGGSIGDLQVRKEDGEYKSLTLGDAERETIQAVARGGILNVSREMLVNDDMSVFNDVAMMLGQSAARTLDKAVFALFALNSGDGPTMGDGNPLFDAAHDNEATTAAAPTVASFDAARVLMSQQLDPSSNDYLDLAPTLWLGTKALGGTARVVNGAEYDNDGTEFQRPNKVRNLFSDIIDTPRLSGNAWYTLADPNIEPVFEVGFLDGVQTPQLASEEAFNQHGMKWRVVYEFGVAAIGWRGIVRNAGVAP